MTESNVIEFSKAAKKNYDIKMSSEDIGNFNSSIIELQGMIIEMFATLENLEELRSSLFTNPKMFDYKVDEENIEKINTMLKYKEKEKSVRLAA